MHLKSGACAAPDPYQDLVRSLVLEIFAHMMLLGGDMVVFTNWGPFSVGVLVMRALLF